MAAARKIELEIGIDGIDKVNTDLEGLQSNLSEMKSQLKDVKQGSTEFNNLSQSISQAESQINNLTQAQEETNKSAGTLKQQLKAMTLELQGLEPGSARFNELTIKAGQLKDQIADTNAVIKATSGSGVQNLGKGLGTAIKIGLNGFQAMTGAVALFGGESKRLQETMVKLQAIMALTQAISSFGELGDQMTEMRASFNAFFKSAKAGLQGIKGAVAATGIGLLLVASGLLVAYWEDIVSLFSSGTKEQQKLVDAAKRKVEVSEHEQELSSLQENSLRLQGKSEKEILQIRLQKITTTIKDQEAYIATMETKKNLEIANAKRNADFTKQIIRGALEMGTATLRAIALPIDALILTANKLSETLGFGKITTFSINDEISKMNKSATDYLSKLFFDPETVAQESEKTLKEERMRLEKMKSDRDGILLSIKKAEEDAANDSRKSAEEKAKALEELRKQQLEIIKGINQREQESNQNLIDAKIAAMENGVEKEVEIVKRGYEKERAGIVDKAIEEEVKKLDERFTKGKINQEQYNIEIEKLKKDAIEKGLYLTDSEKSLLLEKENAAKAAILKIKQDAAAEELKKQEELAKKKADYQKFSESLVKDADEKAKIDIKNKFESEKAQLDGFLKDKIISEEQYSKDLEQITKDRDKSIEDLQKASHDKQILKYKGFFDATTNILKGFGDSAAGLFANIGSSITTALSTTFELTTKTFDNFDFKLGNTAEKVNAYAQAVGGMINSILGSVENDQKERLDKSLKNVEDSYKSEMTALDNNKKLGKITEEEYAKAKYQIELNKFNKEEELKKKAFEADKKLKIAQAITSGLQGAVAAFAGAMSLGPVAGPIVGGILAGIVATMTAVNVGKIAATKYEGGTAPQLETGGAGGGAGGLSEGGGGNQAPQPSITTLFGAPMTGGNEGSNVESPGQRQNVMRAYVLESDITTSQNTISKYEQRAVIG